MRRRHGWQLPLHPLQVIGVSVYGLLVVAFYAFLGPFIGNRVAENTLLTLFTFSASSVMVLFVRCTAIDPSDKTSLKKKKSFNSCGLTKLDYGYIASQISVRILRKVENVILKRFIRRRYLRQYQHSGFFMEPFLPFPLIVNDDAVLPNFKEDNMMYCSLCDFQVKINSKHCRSCDRCVEGFDHHCRWLNNCIGRKNYTTFILLMVFALLMLLIEGATAIAIFVRCFADESGISEELQHKLHMKFPRGVIAATSVLLTLITAYGTIALGQLFVFHVILIKKGMQTYDYILAMKEESQSIELWDDSGLSSDEDADDMDSLSKTPRRSCLGDKSNNESWKRLSIRIDGDSEAKESAAKNLFRVSINPWTLIKMSEQKALRSAAKAKERMAKGKERVGHEATRSMSMQPLSTETKHGPSTMTAVVAKSGKLSSPRRRISGSPTLLNPSPKAKQSYRTNFDLKLTQVSQELETYISRQALSSVLTTKGGDMSPT